MELAHKQEFTTIKQHKKFSAGLVHDKRGTPYVYVIPGSGSQRSVWRREFEGVWNNAKQYDRDTWFLNKGSLLESYEREGGGLGRTINLSYIVELIRYIVQDQDRE